MSDNPKKRKLDAKRISLKQKHEVAYLRKKARELIKVCKTDRKESKGISVAAFFGKNRKIIYYSTSTIERICKALLKCLKKI